MNATACLRNRSKSSWTIQLAWYEIDGNGHKKRCFRSIAVKGTKEKARAKMNEILVAKNSGLYVDPSRMTVGEWLDYWCGNRVKEQLRLRTYEQYESVIRVHLKPEIGLIRLQDLHPVHLEEYYRKKGSKLSQTTLEHHHAVISGALKWAMKKGLIVKNPAALVDNRPSAPEDRNEAKVHCWSAEEAKLFLDTAKTFGVQQAAFYTLALETGLRKGELCGLTWANVDLDMGKVLIDRQLVKCGRPPVFGPIKSGRARTLSISPATVQLLREHRQSQNEVKLKNRQYYRDLGLVFAKEWVQLGAAHARLGDPLQANSLGQREFKKITEAAKVRRIKFHGLRHTCATLLLRAGIPVYVVAQRLGHKGIEITINVYAHVLPDQQEDAANALGDILHGSGN